MNPDPEDFPPKTLEPPSAWACFRVAAVVAVGWLALGSKVVGPLVVLIDPLVVLAFSLFAGAVVVGDRSRARFGLTVRGMLAAVAAAAAVLFFATRTMTGYGEDATLQIAVMAQDRATGRPLDSARVRALHRDSELSSSITDREGRALLEFPCRVRTRFSRAYGWRSITPDPVTVEVEHPAYATGRRSLSWPVEFRLAWIDPRFTRPEGRIRVEALMSLTR